FPLPVEVIPMARSHVARELVKLGGDPVYREGVVTDNGNIILDVHNMSITNPVKLEADINAIVGVATNGLFAARPADLLLLGTAEGVKTLKRYNPAWMKSGDPLKRFPGLHQGYGCKLFTCAAGATR